jgi:hypothetical protein
VDRYASDGDIKISLYHRNPEDFRGFFREKFEICVACAARLKVRARACLQAMALAPNFFEGIRMKKIVYAAFTSAAAMALAACGGSEPASDDAAADNAEAMAEEAVAEEGAAEEGAADEAAPAEGAAEDAAAEEPAAE